MIRSKGIWLPGVKTALVLAVAFPMLAACVGSGTHKKVVAENENLERQNMEMEREVHDQDAEIAQMKAKQAKIARELDGLLSAGQLKMELLADGLHLNLTEDILFASGETQLSETGREVIGTLAGELLEIPYQIIVTGSTDNVPVGEALSEHYPTNWEIGGARAASVVRLIESKGVPSAQLAAVSLGSARPIASNDTPEGRAENRNIEILLRPVIRQ